MKLTLEALARYPGGFSIDVSLACEFSALALVGPSGSGKTSVLDVIAGFRPGRVQIDGRDLTALPVQERRVGYVTQHPHLFPHLTVGQNIAFSPRASKGREVAEVLDVLHLWDRAPRNLSGGEQRRVALARAIASQPDVLLLDEPFSGLDEQRRRASIALLVHLRDALRIPMILVSHIPEEVVGLTDQAYRLEAGRIVSAGTSLQVLRKGESQIDNVFSAQVNGPGEILCGGTPLAAAIPAEATGEILVGCFAHEILLAQPFEAKISARNRIDVTVTKVEEAGEALLVSFAGFPLRSLITKQAAGELGLHVGAKLLAIIKATSFAYLGKPLG